MLNRSMHTTNISASNAALLHNLYIPQIVTPSVGNKRKRAYGRDDEKAQKRSRTESPLSRKRTPSGVNKRKRDDGKDQEEEEEISTKRSRSMPHSEDLSLASTGERNFTPALLNRADPTLKSIQILGQRHLDVRIPEMYYLLGLQNSQPNRRNRRNRWGPLTII